MSARPPPIGSDSNDARTIDRILMPDHLAIVAIAFVAALVNGALGYGFSSITVPVALLFVTNRVLNPAIVLVEVMLNVAMLWSNRGAFAAVWPRVMPIAVGLLPGVVIGTLVVSSASPAWLKVGTYAVLLPLILLQVAGVRRPVRAGRTSGVVFGGALGVLYAVTTISGPPLAIALNNQGFTKQDFRASLAVVRLIESTLTLAAYAVAGLLITESRAIVPELLYGMFFGVPVGAMLIRHVQPETFRRICMSVDAWLVAFGLTATLRAVQVIDRGVSVLVVVTVVAIDLVFLYQFFARRRRADAQVAASRDA
jgi:uncharacterized protein